MWDQAAEKERKAKFKKEQLARLKAEAQHAQQMRRAEMESCDDESCASSQGEAVLGFSRGGLAGAAESGHTQPHQEELLLQDLSNSCLRSAESSSLPKAPSRDKAVSQRLQLAGGRT